MQLLTMAVVLAVGAASPPATVRVAEGFSGVISASGRYVAFSTDTDAYLKDLRTGRVTLISATPAGAPGAGASYDPDVSADGRFVSFTSEAPDLVPGDTNGITDVFVRDVHTGRTLRASVTTSGGQAEGEPFEGSFNAEISDDGRRVAFTSSAAGLSSAGGDVFVRDLRAGTTVRVSVGAVGGGYAPSISADGRYVAFLSNAADLVAGDTNDEGDAFVRDLRTRTTERVTVSSSGAQASGGICCGDDVAISSTGRYVAFASYASNLVPGDTSGLDVFVRDRPARTTTRAALTSTGGELDADAGNPSISADGRYVAFASRAGNAVPSDTNNRSDVFVRDRRAGTTTRVSVSSSGAQGNGDSAYPSLSRDGRTGVFGSYASNLVAHDTNAASDVFLRRR